MRPRFFLTTPFTSLVACAVVLSLALVGPSAFGQCSPGCRPPSAYPPMPPPDASPVADRLERLQVEVLGRLEQSTRRGSAAEVRDLAESFVLIQTARTLQEAEKVSKAIQELPADIMHHAAFGVLELARRKPVQPTFEVPGEPPPWFLQLRDLDASIRVTEEPRQGMIEADQIPAYAPTRMISVLSQ